MTTKPSDLLPSRKELSKLSTQEQKRELLKAIVLVIEASLKTRKRKGDTLTFAAQAIAEISVIAPDIHTRAFLDHMASWLMRADKWEPELRPEDA